MSTADELFKRLDGQIVRSCDQSRRIEIHGIREAENRFWIQLALLDGGEAMPLVLNMGATVPPSTALARIEHWLANPDEGEGRMIVVD
jgi:hypothetical protein